MVNSKEYFRKAHKRNQCGRLTDVRATRTSLISQHSTKAHLRRTSSGKLVKIRAYTTKGNGMSGSQLMRKYNQERRLQKNYKRALQKWSQERDSFIRTVKEEQMTRWVSLHIGCNCSTPFGRFSCRCPNSTHGKSSLEKKVKKWIADNPRPTFKI